MADPREDFEHDYAKESDWTEARMKFCRSTDGGYQSGELHLIYKGWRLAKYRKVRAALRDTTHPTDSGGAE